MFDFFLLLCIMFGAIKTSLLCSKGITFILHYVDMIFTSTVTDFCFIACYIKAKWLPRCNPFSLWLGKHETNFVEVKKRGGG